MKPVLKNLTIIFLISSTLLVASFYIPSVSPTKQNAGNNYNYPTDEDMVFYETRNPCLRIGDVIVSVFFFVRWFVGRLGRAVGQTHAAAKLGL